MQLLTHIPQKARPQPQCCIARRQATTWSRTANAVQQYDWTSVLEQAVDDYDSQYRTCVLQVRTMPSWSGSWANSSLL